MQKVEMIKEDLYRWPDGSLWMLVDIVDNTAYFTNGPTDSSPSTWAVPVCFAELCQHLGKHLWNDDDGPASIEDIASGARTGRVDCSSPTQSNSPKSDAAPLFCAKCDQEPIQQQIAEWYHINCYSCRAAAKSAISMRVAINIWDMMQKEQAKKISNEQSVCPTREDFATSLIEDPKHVAEALLAQRELDVKQPPEGHIICKCLNGCKHTILEEKAVREAGKWTCAECKHVYPLEENEVFQKVRLKRLEIKVSNGKMHTDGHYLHQWCNKTSFRLVEYGMPNGDIKYDYCLGVSEIWDTDLNERAQCYGSPARPHLKEGLESGRYIVIHPQAIWVLA